MHQLLRDIRYGVRALARDKVFSATVIATLAVCIAANTATFSIVNSVLLRPLPVPESESILLMANSYPGAGVGDLKLSAAGDYYDRLRDVTVFSEQAMFSMGGQTVEIGGTPQRIEAMNATPSLFRLLRIPPALGRTFDDEEGEIGAERKVILSYGLWRQLYGGDPAAVGRDLRLSGRQYTVVGVMPADFSFVNPAVKLWTPLAFSAELKQTHHSNNWYNIGRLKPGATIQQAQTQVDALNAANLEKMPQMQASPDRRGLPHCCHAAARDAGRRRQKHPLLALGRRRLRASDRGAQRRESGARPDDPQTQGIGDAASLGSARLAGYAAVHHREPAGGAGGRSRRRRSRRGLAARSATLRTRATSARLRNPNGRLGRSGRHGDGRDCGSVNRLRPARPSLPHQPEPGAARRQPRRHQQPRNQPPAPDSRSGADRLRLRASARRRSAVRKPARTASCQPRIPHRPCAHDVHPSVLGDVQGRQRTARPHAAILGGHSRHSGSRSGRRHHLHPVRQR